MSRHPSPAEYERTHRRLTEALSYRDGYVRDARGRCDEVLCAVYAQKRMPDSDANARRITSALHRYGIVAERRGKPWNAPAKDVRQIMDEVLTTRFKVEVGPGIGPGRTVFCQPETNPDTVRKFAGDVKDGFETLLELFLRSGRNPLARQAIRAGAVSHPNVRRPAGGSVPPPTRSGFGPRIPSGYYKVEGKAAMLISVEDGEKLLDDMRAAAAAVSFPPRFEAILELGADSGARLTEVTEASCQSLQKPTIVTEQSRPGDGGQVRKRERVVNSEGVKALYLHNKRQGRTPRKLVKLSARGSEALETYFLTVWIHHDPLRLRFKAWARGRPYTPLNYLRFLIASGISPLTVPLFLTSAGKPYTAATFRRVAWQKAREMAGVSASFHHIRHAFVYRELAGIAEEYGKDGYRYVLELMAFCRRMGWEDWRSLGHYDHLGVAITILKEHFGSDTNVTAEPQPVTHGNVTAEARRHANQDRAAKANIYGSLEVAR